MTEEIWYRYEDVAYSSYPNEMGDCHGPATIAVELREHRVVRRTPKGVWLDLGLPRFVLVGARKQFAWPTREEALTSFVARKRRQIRIHEAQASRARRALEIAATIDPSVRPLDSGRHCIL